jgi:quercetin dioxygenase-like cupin family protein
MAALAAAPLLTAAPAFAEDAPQLLPPSPPSHLVVFTVEAPGPAQYEETVVLQDFEPGAWTVERRHDGMAFFSVLDGAIAVKKAGKVTLYARGQSFRIDAGEYYSAGNISNAGARLITTTLTEPGAPSDAPHPDADRPLKTPSTAASGHTTLNTVGGRFTLNQLILSFRPGAGSGAHVHPEGQGIAIVIEGEQRNRLLDGEIVLQKLGDAFVDRPNRPVSHENNGSTMLTVLASYVFNAGTPPGLPAVIPGVMPLPAPPAPSR